MITAFLLSAWKTWLVYQETADFAPIYQWDNQVSRNYDLSFVVARGKLSWSFALLVIHISLRGRRGNVIMVNIASIAMLMTRSCIFHWTQSSFLLSIIEFGYGDKWMQTNYLKQNNDKTEILWVGPQTNIYSQA